MGDLFPSGNRLKKNMEQPQDDSYSNLYHLLWDSIIEKDDFTEQGFEFQYGLYTPMPNIEHIALEALIKMVSKKDTDSPVPNNVIGP